MKQYAPPARQICEQLFSALEEGQEPGHLPGDPDSENMLLENLAEHISLSSGRLLC